MKEKKECEGEGRKERKERNERIERKKSEKIKKKSIFSTF